MSHHDQEAQARRCDISEAPQFCSIGSSAPMMKSQHWNCHGVHTKLNFELFSETMKLF